MSGNFQVLAAAVAGLAEGQERPVSGGHWAASWAAEDDLTSPAEELVLSMRSHRSKVNFHAMSARASRMALSPVRKHDDTACLKCFVAPFTLLKGDLPCHGHSRGLSGLLIPITSVSTGRGSNLRTQGFR